MYKPFYDFVRQLSPEFKVDPVQLEPLLRTRRVEKGCFLFYEGDCCEFVGLTLSGCLRTFFLKQGKEYTLFFQAEGQPWGDYESFRRGTPACFSCQALEDSEVLLVDGQALRWFEFAPGGQQFLRLHAENLAFTLRDKLLSLFRDSPEQRYLQLVQNEPALLKRIPQYYLASYLGIEPESLSRLKRRIQPPLNPSQ
ncbi:MAG TPA: Crp/Fnr family transcriptional regulator [Trichocoleus sp.]